MTNTALEATASSSGKTDSSLDLHQLAIRIADGNEISLFTAQRHKIVVRWCYCRVDKIHFLRRLLFLLRPFIVALRFVRLHRSLLKRHWQGRRRKSDGCICCWCCSCYKWRPSSKCRQRSSNEISYFKLTDECGRSVTGCGRETGLFLDKWCFFCLIELVADFN